MNIPNALSLLRILMIPLYCVVYLNAPAVQEGAPFSLIAEYMWAAGILILSGLTDFLDGVIARRFDLITPLGRFLDPCADKLTQVAVTVTLAIRNPDWTILPILYFGKELLMLIGGIRLMKKFKDIAPSRWFGKMATGVFYGSTILLVALPSMPSWAKTTLIVFIIVTLVFAFAMYFPLFFRYFSGQKDLIPDEQTAHTSADRQ